MQVMCQSEIPDCLNGFVNIFIIIIRQFDCDNYAANRKIG